MKKRRKRANSKSYINNTGARSNAGGEEEGVGGSDCRNRGIKGGASASLTADTFPT